MEPALIEQHGLTAAEYARIVASLGREPNLAELGIFSVMWSEHCSYKSSKRLLRQFPTTGPQVVQGPGENAGVIHFTDDLVLVFKMESHNHPSFIEPHQGAATGVGGILRDVFTMGARPIAILDSLRFGAVDHPKTPYLVSGVVSGVGSYGNCVGVPTVGGEVAFAPSYNGNNLVNAMTVGVARRDALFFGKASGVGNPVLYVGAKTGRDGIHGATMASAVFGDGNEARRPTVQVGDPFMEKLLLEACLEAMQTGAVLGIQDMGAAGLTSSSFEMAARAGSGLELSLDHVPRREVGMTPYELMLSESQERMLLVVAAGREAEVLAVFAKWDLAAATVGRVTASGRVVAVEHGAVVIDLPVGPVVDEAPVYERPSAPPAWLAAAQQFDVSTVPMPTDCNAVLRQLLGSPNLASKAWVYRQYDQQVGTRSVVLPGSDAAVLRVDGTTRGVAITTDCNSRYCYLDPALGAAHAVAEAARNLVCSGAEPQAITDCLNFGSPEQPEIMWQLEQAVAGMAEACRQFHTPVVSGNVSLYNETNGHAIDPTPTVGMVGILDDVQQHCRQGFSTAGDVIVLLGDVRGELGASEYLATIHGLVRGTPPPLNYDRERAVQRACLVAIRRGLVHAAHDCSDGGLAVALAECCVSGPQPIGAHVQFPHEGRVDAALFGEAPARILLAVSAMDLPLVTTIAQEHCIPVQPLGRVGGERLVINDWVDCPIAALYDGWANGFARSLGFSTPEGD
ncbi:MAG: phosphoribosylformylglycinamidine synthase subunit PurL [Deltaproteobacteria bacterium]|nr:phosphoribosylformylglycinamidine synthase subunit PurL [Deltaproteobacteria bacterium]